MKRFYLVLFLMALTLLSALSTGFSLFHRLFYILGLTVMGSYVWTWLSPRWLDVQVDRRTSTAQVGDYVEERITVRNTGVLPKSWLEVEDVTDLPGHSSGQIISLPSRSFRSWKTTTLCRRRGVYTLGPLKVTSGDPFGLFRKEKDFAGVQALVVYPRAVELPKFTIPAADLSGDGPLRQRSHHVTPHASTLRDYVHGDSLSHIHWPSTARLGKLMSKEFDLGLSSEVWIFLDLHQDVQAGQDEESTDEYSVSIAASIARKYLGSQLPVGLVAYGDRRYFLPAESGSGQMAHIMGFLALSRSEGQVPLVEALPREEALFSRYASLVIITPSYTSDWTLALRQLAKRRVRIAVVLVDPSTFGGRHSNLHVQGSLATYGLPAYVVNKGDNLSQALSRVHTGPPALMAMGSRRESLL